MASRSSRDVEKSKNVKRKKKLTKRQQQKRKLVILGMEVVCLAVLLGGLYVWSMFSKIDIDSDFNDSEAGINEDLEDDTILTLGGYTNIALFGLDNRGSGEYEKGHSDTIMIASINNETKEVKLISVYRDTYLSIGGGKYNKANNAYYAGGAKQAIQMLNSNLDLNIKEYVCVDWAALVEAIDALGGIELEITSQEAELINAYIWEIDEMMGSKSEAVVGGGLKALTGAQATSYARIRKTSGDDFKRSSRQRIVLEAMLNKAKEADLATLLDICNAVFDDVSTSLELSEILALAKHVKEYTIVSTTGFPFEITGKTLSGTGSTVIPIDLADNVARLHTYMFGVENYEPSKTVSAISDTIIQKTGVTEGTPSVNVDEYNDTAGQIGTVFKEDETESTETEE